MQPRGGGAIYAQQTNLALTDVAFTDNVATAAGGGVYLTSEGTSGTGILAG